MGQLPTASGQTQWQSQPALSTVGALFHSSLTAAALPLTAVEFSYSRDAFGTQRRNFPIGPGKNPGPPLTRLFLPIFMKMP